LLDNKIFSDGNFSQALIFSKLIATYMITEEAEFRIEAAKEFIEFLRTGLQKSIWFS